MVIKDSMYVDAKHQKKIGKNKSPITHLQNFIDEITVSLSHNTRKTSVNTGLVLGPRFLSHPALTVKFEPKDLVLSVFYYLITSFYNFLYCIPFKLGTKVFLQNWQEMPARTFSVATQRSIFLHCQQ